MIVSELVVRDAAKNDEEIVGIKRLWGVSAT